MTDKQPEALWAADQLAYAKSPDDLGIVADKAAALLRTQHAAIERKDALLRRMVDAWDDPEQSMIACYGVVQAIKQELSQ